MPRPSASFQALTPQQIRFRREFLDFRRGIQVGNLSDDERITRILKLALESRYQQSFVTERWGRGVYWQWIGYLAKANRAAKPMSSKVSFGCSKFFLMIDKDEQLFKCGLQVERGFLTAPAGEDRLVLSADWDWHRLLQALQPKGPMEKELKRLVTREGFWLQAGSWHSEVCRFSKPTLPTVSQLRSRLEKFPGSGWAGFMLYFPMNEEAVRRSSGIDLVESMLAIFEEVTPAMRLCSQTPL
jgi:hypothetical protein